MTAKNNATLCRRDDRYDLYAEDGHKIASSATNTFGKLSKQNCDELFGVIDVEKLSEKEIVQEHHDSFLINKRLGFIDGFNKAMELYLEKEIDVIFNTDIKDSEGCLILKRIV